MPKKLSERADWFDDRIAGIFTCRHECLTVELFADGRGMFSMRCAPLINHRRFRIKGGPDAAKAEALRIAQEAVAQLAEAWKD